MMIIFWHEFLIELKCSFCWDEILSVFHVFTGKAPQFQCPFCVYRAKQKMHIGRHMERMHKNNAAMLKAAAAAVVAATAAAATSIKRENEENSSDSYSTSEKD